jgi:hypothetical protein
LDRIEGNKLGTRPIKSPRGDEAAYRSKPNGKNRCVCLGRAYISWLKPEFQISESPAVLGRAHARLAFASIRTYNKALHRGEGPVDGEVLILATDHRVNLSLPG